MSAAGSPKPAHAMGQPSRREPGLGIAKALADPPEHGSFRHPEPVEPDHRMATRDVLIKRFKNPLDNDPRRIHRCQEHRGPGRAAFVIVGFGHDDCDVAPTAPVISHFSPSMTKSPRLPLMARCALVFSIEGSDPAPGAGSVIIKHECSPAANGRSQRSF